MGPDHLDSPASLSLIMQAMRARDARGSAMLGHTNSGAIIGSDLIETKALA